MVLVWLNHGLVWFGLVWFGLVWFGLVWFGLVLPVVWPWLSIWLNLGLVNSRVRNILPATYDATPAFLDRYACQKISADKLGLHLCLESQNSNFLLL